ncbi:MAG TPA: PIN domain-containing protein [Candidatus Acidoferrum sp.]|nr:PIN domain-containing protein [Candidatus Acidoferrum sp.]
MREFFDTSVLINAFLETQHHHESSFQRFAAAESRHSACGVHTLAEIYNGLTKLPRRPMVLSEQVLLFLEEVRSRVTPIVLDAEEYFATIRQVAGRGLTGGRIYDALLLACAEKSDAQVIYTWNLKHFQAIAPHLADRIQTP